MGRARIEPGDTTVVVGLGSIGCLFVQLLKRAGAAVVGCDNLSDRVALAGRLGADAGGPDDVTGQAVRKLSGGRGADQVIVTGGGSEGLPWVAGILRDGGTVHYFAGGDRHTLPPSPQRPHQ